MTDIPLFPLRAVLLPHGRMSLQVFERRYLDMVSQCLKSDQGFGVVWIRTGSEVAELDRPAPQLTQIGTYARIKDWHTRPNGMLGIVIEGERRFRLLSSQQRDDQLHIAQVEWLEDGADIDLPLQAAPLRELVGQLLNHPHIQRLGYPAALDDAETLSCVLSQLLPIDEAMKFRLLSANDAVARLEQLALLLDQMGQ